MEVRSPLRNLDANKKYDKVQEGAKIVDKVGRGESKPNSTFASIPTGKPPTPSKEILDDDTVTGVYNDGIEPIPIYDGTPKKRKIRSSVMDAPSSPGPARQSGSKVEQRTPPRPVAPNSVLVEKLLKRLELVEHRLAESEASRERDAEDEARRASDLRAERLRGPGFSTRQEFCNRMHAASASAVDLMLRGTRRSGEAGLESRDARAIARRMNPSLDPLGEQGTEEGGPIVNISELSFLKNKLASWRANYTPSETSEEKAGEGSAEPEAEAGSGEISL